MQHAEAKTQELSFGVLFKFLSFTSQDNSTGVQIVLLLFSQT